MFFKDVDKYPIYSGEEQIELARQAQHGDEKSRQKLINSNLKFVVTCAKQYTGQGVPLLDLIQYGTCGLIKSIDKFDPDKGYKFISFAVWYIRKELLQAIYNTGRTIRYPISYICKATKVKKAHDEFLSKYGREPSEEELLKLTNLSHKQITSTVVNKSYCSSLDTPLTEDDSLCLGDTISEEVPPLQDPFTKETINGALKILNEREYTVITMFYGLNGNDESSIKDISKVLHVGEERVRQLRKGAIKKLEKRCGKILKTLL